MLLINSVFAETDPRKRYRTTYNGSNTDVTDIALSPNLSIIARGFGEKKKDGSIKYKDAKIRIDNNINGKTIFTIDTQALGVPYALKFLNDGGHPLSYQIKKIPPLIENDRVTQKPTRDELLSVKGATDKNTIDCDNFRNAEGDKRIHAFSEIIENHFKKPGSSVGMLVDAYIPKHKIRVDTFIKACGKPDFKGDLEHRNIKNLILYSIISSNRMYVYANIVKEGDYIARIEVPLRFEMEVNELYAKIKQRKDDLASREPFQPITNIDNFNTLFGITLGESAYDVYDRAIAKNIKTFKLSKIGPDHMGRIEVHDTLDGTSAGMTNNVFHNNERVYAIDSHVRQGEYIPYLKKKLEEKYQGKPNERNGRLTGLTDYFLPNGARVTLLMRENTSGIVKLHDIKAYEAWQEDVKKKRAEMEAEKKAYAKRDSFKPIKDFTELDSFIGIPFRADLNVAIEKAKELNIEFSTNIPIEEKGHGRMEFKDNFNKTRSAKKIVVTFFDKLAYRIKSHQADPEFINYLKKELAKVTEPKEGYIEPFSDRIDKKYKTYNLPNNISIALSDKTFVVEDLNQIEKVKAFIDELKKKR